MNAFFYFIAIIFLAHMATKIYQELKEQIKQEVKDELADENE